MVYDNEMKDKVEQIKKDLEEEKAAHAATLYEVAKLRETLDEIGYKPLSVIKNEAHRAGFEEGKKRAARECLKWMIQNRCISETQANNFCCNFELQEAENDN